MKQLNNLESSYIGQLDFVKAEMMQKDLYQLAKTKRLNSIIGVEHPAVVTLGYRMQRDKVSLFNQEIPVVQSTRGGLVTIHSEGQLVIYPILDLKAAGLGVKDYVLMLLTTTKNLLAEFNIASSIDEQAIGLYTAKGKIAFCGIQVKNGISLHGLSLNVRNDLSFFKEIISCGVQNSQLDRLQNYGVNLTLEELFKRWVILFKIQLKPVQTDRPRH
jgi:lipoyl(octanoyl) transferase